MIFPRRVLDYVAPGNPDLARARAARYPARMESEWATIAPYVPDDVQDIMDIGCGLGGIDVMIARHHPVDKIVLVDGNGDLSLRGKLGFKTAQKAWADVRIAEEFVRANARVFEIVAANPAIVWSAVGDLDLIVSLRSWGHHYPAATYAALAFGALRNGGRSILDIRRNTDGRKQMEAAGFRFLAICDEGKKHQRMVFER